MQTYASNIYINKNETVTSYRSNTNKTQVQKYAKDLRENYIHLEELMLNVHLQLNELREILNFQNMGHHPSFNSSTPPQKNPSFHTLKLDGSYLGFKY